MLSRRSFLKMSGLAVTAACAGFGAGRLWGESAFADAFAVRGFLPADRAVLDRVVDAFVARVRVHTEPVVLAEGPWLGILTRAYGDAVMRRNPQHFSGQGEVVFRLDALASPLPGDILVSDGDRLVCVPERDVTKPFRDLRHAIHGQPASVAFTGEYRRRGLIEAAAPGRERVVVVRSQEGRLQRAPLDGRTVCLDAEGPRGKTRIRVADGMAWVEESPCGHQLCRKAGPIGRSGQALACVPNGVILSVESV